MGRWIGEVRLKISTTGDGKLCDLTVDVREAWSWDRRGEETGVAVDVVGMKK